MRTPAALIAAALLVAGLTLGAARGELAGRSYSGYFATDRWGRDVFFTGPCHAFLSEAVARELRPLAGVPVLLDADKVFQPMNPGAVRIESVRSATTRPLPPLELAARIDAETAPPGRGFHLRVTARNRDSRTVELGPEGLAAVLVTDAPEAHDVAGFKDPRGIAYWYYSDALYDRDGSLVRYGCHESALTWAPEQLARSGTGARVGATKPTHREPGTYLPLVVDSGGTFELEAATVGAELPPGKYELFVFQPIGGFSNDPGAVSNRLRIDVTGGAK